MKNGFGIDEEAYKAIFAKNLRDALYMRQVSQRELARRIGVSSTTVSEWCKGKTSPRMDKIDAICKILNVKRSDLMLGERDHEEILEVTDKDIALARQIMRLDAYRMALIESIINTDPEAKK